MTEDKYKKMIRELLADDSDKLTAWECEFLDSVDNAIACYDLTPKQIAILEKIWNKVFA